MKIMRLEVSNWGPFRESQDIDLQVNSSSPVILFHGENMRGKTSLLRAIVWCLYGKLKTQDGKTDLPVAKLVNTVSLETQQTVDYSVRLTVDHQGQVYVLTRGGTAELSDGTVFTVSSHVSLLPEGGSPFATEHIPEKIDTLLSYEVSNFFFFDGEMLARFEERLKDEAKPFVKRQIEQALGLPFLKALEGDLDILRQKVDDDIQKTLKANKKALSLIDKYNALDDELSKKVIDVNTMKDLVSDAEDSLAKIEDELASVDSIKDLFHERRSLEASIAQMKRELDDLVRDSMTYHEEYWWFPLAKKLTHEQRSLVTRINKASSINEERIRLDMEIKNLRSQVEGRHCPTCGQPNLPENREAIETKLHAKERTREALVFDDDLQVLTRRLDRVGKYQTGSAVVTRIIDASKDIRKTRLRLLRAESKLVEIGEDLRGNTIDIASKESQRDSLKKKLLERKQIIEAGESKIDSLRAEKRKLSDDISKNPEVKSQDRRRLDALTYANSIVKESFDEFGHQMRLKVQRRASEIFRALTTEPKYTGVSISNDYSLRILDSRSNPVDLASAGGSQILTMSFIGALADCSADEAPMVMDTPFGRLDEGHRAAILHWVREFDNQIILFVQSGEYSVERDRPSLGNKVGREYRIERISERESRVVTEAS